MGHVFVPHFGEPCRSFILGNVSWYVDASGAALHVTWRVLEKRASEQNTVLIRQKNASLSSLRACAAHPILLSLSLSLFTIEEEPRERPRGGTSARLRGVDAADRADRLWAATWRFRRSRSSATAAAASLARTNAIRSASRCSRASLSCATAADRHLTSCLNRSRIAARSVTASLLDANNPATSCSVIARALSSACR